MEDFTSLQGIIFTALGTIILGGVGVVITWFNYLKRKIDGLEKGNKEKEESIKHLHNGFRESVDNRLTNLEAMLEKQTVVLEGYSQILKVLATKEKNEKTNK